MPVASAISPHSIQGSPRALHHTGAKGIGRGNGSGSDPGPEFGDLLRGQAGVVSKPGGGVSGAPGTPGVKAKQVSTPVAGQVPEQNSGQNSGQTSAQTNGAMEAPTAGQIQQGFKAKAAGHMDSVAAQSQALSKDGTQVADADDLQAAMLNAAEFGSIEKVDNAKLSPDGTYGGDGKAPKSKDGKEIEDKEDKINAAQPATEKLPQVPVENAASASLAAPASVAVPVLVRPVLQKLTKAESAASPRGPDASAAAKSAAGKLGPQAAQEAAEGKIQESAADGKGLPAPNAFSAPQSIQAGAEQGGAAAVTDLAGRTDVASIAKQEKQDVSAIAAKPDSGTVAPTKHQDSSLPAAVHSAQIAQAAASGTGEIAAHIPASSQNFSGVSGPASGASSAASPYDRIDQGTAPVVLHSGAQQVAVGIHDPGLGWVEIKTQSAAGHVDATLVADSGQTHDSLAAQLPAISQFLEQRDVRIGTIAVQQQSAGNGANHFGNNSGGGAGAQHSGSGYGGNGASSGNNGNSGSQRHAPRYNNPAVASHSGPLTGITGENSSPPRPLSYISVRA